MSKHTPRLLETRHREPLPSLCCDGKTRFTSAELALRAAAHATHTRLNVYRCPCCSNFHLTKNRS